MTDHDSAQDLMLERTFEAPPEIIWQLWTEAEHFAAWYGPIGASISVTIMDVRPGGTRLLRMEVDTPDGARAMWFTGEYLEVIENQRLVYTDSISDEDGVVLSPEQAGMPASHPTTTKVCVDLHRAGGGTKMVMTHIGIAADTPGAAGWDMALDKLEMHAQQ